MDRKVTALRVQKRNPNRVNVYLDGEYSFGLSRIVAAWLRLGDMISEEKIEQLRKKDEKEVALQNALRFVDYKPRSVAEVKKKLSDKGFDVNVIEEILTRLIENGTLDDARFAQGWAENRSYFRPRGRRLLALELRQKGIPNHLIEEALDPLPEEDSLAYQAGEKQVRRWQGLEWQAFRQKMGQFLARRGFRMESILNVLPRLYELSQSEPSREYSMDNGEFEK